MQVSVEKIAKYAKHFDLLIIHEPESILPYQEFAKGAFHSALFKSPGEIAAEHASINCHLLIISGSFDFLKSPSLKNALAQVHSLESILFTSDFRNINVYKMALYFRALSVNGVPENDEEFANALMGIFSSLIKKHNESVLGNYDRMISEFSNNLFWIRKQSKAVYANETLKRKFGVRNLDDIDKMFQDKEFQDLFKTPGTSQKIVSKTDASGELKEYLFTHQLLKDDEYLIAMVPLNTSLQKNEKQLHNRMGFIELLKNSFVIHQRENEAVPVIVMHVENSAKIIEMNGEEAYNTACKEMVQLVRLNFDPDAEIAQWNKHIYTLLSPNASLDQLKASLEKFHQNLNLDASVEGASLMIGSFVIDMHGVELNKAISIIDHIKHKQLISRDLTHLVHYEISASPEESVDENEHALHYLEK